MKGREQMNTGHIATTTIKIGSSTPNSDEFRKRLEAAEVAFGTAGQVQILIDTVILLTEANEDLYKKIAALEQEARQPER
jgi:hypothetical protein